jgi:hypothetical protein
MASDFATGLPIPYPTSHPSAARRSSGLACHPAREGIVFLGLLDCRQGRAGRWREAEFTGECADEVGVVAHNLVEGVLDEIPTSSTAGEWAALLKHRGSTFIPDDRLAVDAQYVGIHAGQDAGMRVVANDAVPDRLSRRTHAFGHRRYVPGLGCIAIEARRPAL